MNRLSAELLKGLLEEAEIPRKEIVGMYGGGFKPPTIGHLEVVKRALDQNPEMDKMIVLVGSGERDSITQAESLTIWRIYQKYLPKKLEIQPAPEGKPPIGAIYSYAKNNPDKEVYWFIGAREGNEEDFQDIMKRTKSLRSGDYPNVKVKEIVTQGGVSGTKARKALLNRDKATFSQYLPDISEFDQIWDMLSDTMGINEEKNPIQPNHKLLAKKGAYVYHNGSKLHLKRRKLYDVKGIIENRYTLEDKQGRQYWITKSEMDDKWSKYDPEELKKGIEVEKEHTDDHRIAMKIALDHLDEDPKYYTKLATLGLEERISFKVDNFDEREVEFIEDFADDKMRPDIDIDLSGQHFLDRLNDPRNYPDIEPEELEDFFDKLADKKKEFIEFLRKYKQIVAKDRETDINIPFMKAANKAIAKTIMRKRNFQTPNKVLALQEGRYDQEVLTQSRLIFNLFKSMLGEPYKSEDFEFEGNIEDVYYDLQLEFVPTGFDTLGPIPYIIEAAGDEDSIEIIINYNPDAFPENYNKLNAEIKDALRHELEHVGQYNFPKGVTPRDIGDPPIFDYLTTDFEIPAHVQGLYKTAKTKKITLNQAIDDFLEERSEELSAKEETQIKKIWLDWAKKNLPAAQINEIKWTGEPHYPFTRQDSTYSFTNENGNNIELKFDITPYRSAVVAHGTLSPSSPVQGKLSNAIKSANTIGKITQDLVGRYNVDRIDFNNTKQAYSLYNNAIPDYFPNAKVQGNGNGASLILKESLIQDTLNHHIKSLTDYMNSNGLNLKPYPEVEFIENDEENAVNIFGKTAYYMPSAKKITLFTLNRHPKDILRSYAHELVHHHQNLNGTLQNFQTTNTNEDGDLEQIEREAYENGNILFRNWEDSIKNQ
jgi:hypothetical protein